MRPGSFPGGKILMKFSPWFQIMPPRPINEQFFCSCHKEALFLVIFEKIDGPQ